MPRKRATKKHDIEVSTKPRPELELLLRPPPVTMDHIRQEHEAAREAHRGLWGAAIEEDCKTLAAWRQDIADAKDRLADELAI